MTLREADRCPQCRAWHGVPPLAHLRPGEPCGHDQAAPCRLCGEPVGVLSSGGSTICATCEVRGAPMPRCAHHVAWGARTPPPWCNACRIAAGLPRLTGDALDAALRAVRAR